MRRGNKETNKETNEDISFFRRAQVLQPLALGPLFHAKKFILVGDPQQLPPVVTSKAALEDGMDQSLMSALMDSPGKCLVDLNVQYR